MSMYLVPGTPEFLLLCLMLWLALVNGLSVLVFGIDKRRAQAGAWRLPERLLLGLALIGGWPGAKLGQALFRHKTRKMSFRWRLDAIGLMQAAALALVLTPAGGWLTARAQGLVAQLTPSDAAQASAGPVQRIQTGGGSLMDRGNRGNDGLPRRFGPGSGG